MLTKILRDTGLAERATVHGFRSVFRTWASERTSVPHAGQHRGHLGPEHFAGILHLRRARAPA